MTFQKVLLLVWLKNLGPQISDPTGPNPRSFSSCPSSVSVICLGVLYLMYLEAKQDHLIRRVPHTGLPTSKLHRHAWAGWPVPVHVWWYLV